MGYDLDIELLRAFVAVAETGSFTRAAQRLGRVQSAVSMQIKRLEAATGCALFTRGHRRVALAPDGEVLLGYARRMLRLSEQALAELGQSAQAGAVRLGTADTASVFLPGVLSRFAQACPGAQMEVTCDRSWTLLDALDAGELDLALVTQACGRGGGQAIRREPLVWASAAGHLAHEEKPLPLALFSQGCAYRQAAMAALDRGERAWRNAYNSVNLEGVRAAVRAGIAVAVLPQSTLEPGMRVLGAAEGFPPLPDYEITLYRHSGEGNATAERLAEEIVQGLARPIEIPVAAAPASRSATG